MDWILKHPSSKTKVVPASESVGLTAADVRFPPLLPQGIDDLLNALPTRPASHRHGVGGWFRYQIFNALQFRQAAASLRQSIAAIVG